MWSWAVQMNLSLLRPQTVILSHALSGTPESHEHGKKNTYSSVRLIETDMRRKQKEKRVEMNQVQWLIWIRNVTFMTNPSQVSNILTHSAAHCQQGINTAPDLGSTPYSAAVRNCGGNNDRLSKLYTYNRVEEMSAGTDVSLSSHKKHRFEGVRHYWTS